MPPRAPPGPRALPSTLRGPAPPARRWGHLWDAAPSYLALSSHSASGYLERGLFECCLPVSNRRLLPLLWSAPGPPSRSPASAPPRRALPRLASPSGVERRALAAAREPLAVGRSYLVPEGLWLGEGAGRDSPCLDAKNCLAHGTALALEARNPGRGNSELQPVEHLAVSETL